MFGFEVPKDHADALRLDKENGNAKWQEAIDRELSGWQNINKGSCRLSISLGEVSAVCEARMSLSQPVGTETVDEIQKKQSQTKLGLFGR